MKRVALLADRGTPVRLEFADGGVALSAGGENEGRAEEALEVAFEGEPITTAFNPGFLIDGLAAVGGGTARLLFTSANKPVVIRPADRRRGRLHLPDHARPLARLIRPRTTDRCMSGT